MATSTIKKDAPLFIRGATSYKIAKVEGNKLFLVTATMLGIDPPTGYKIIGFYGAYTNNGSVAIIGTRPPTSGSTSTLYVRNLTSTDQTNVTVYAYITYAREDLCNV